MFHKSSIEGLLYACTLVVLCVVGTSSATAQQQPDIGSDGQVWSAVDQVWAIRKSKKWGETLNSAEHSAVSLAIDSIDDWMMRKDVGFFTPQVLALLFQGKVAETTKIRVVARHEAYAGFDPSSKTIDVSVGFLQAMYWTQWALEEARENPVLMRRLPEYLFALSRNNFQRTPLSASSVIRLSEFVTGKTWNPDNKMTNEIGTRVSNSVLGGLVYLVAHEGCHVTLGHKPQVAGKDSISQEWGADQCTVGRLNRATIDTFNPYLALAVLSLQELDDRGERRTTTTHPLALCRMGWMLYNNGANGVPSAVRSIALFPLLVELSKFPTLSESDIKSLPSEYRTPNFLAAKRIASSCGGYQVLNPRAFKSADNK